jgi:hypothetical protein
MVIAASFVSACCGGAFASEETLDSPLALVSAGGIELKGRTDVRLMSESFRIRFAEHGKVWNLTAEYALHNPGKTASVDVAVPTRWPASYFSRDEPPTPLGDASKAVGDWLRSVSLELGGAEVPCKARFEHGRPGEVRATCIARLEVPSGESMVSLRYRGGPYAERVGQAYVARAEFDPNPGAHWTPVRSLVLDLQLGKSPPARVVSPPADRHDGGHLTWKYENADATRAQPVVVDLGTAVGDGWVRREVSLRTSASSTLPAQGAFSYDPARAVDADRRTAWCEGAPGDGVGETLSVSFAMPEPRPGGECRLLDLEVVPGLARSERTYSANGRVTRARFENCSDPKDGFDADLEAGADANVRHGLPDPDRFDEPPVEVAIPPGTLSGTTCVRMVIRGVRRGSKYSDTCVSEFIPRVYCRTVPSKVAAPTGPPPKQSAPVDWSKLWTPEVAACARRIQARMVDAVAGTSGAWANLIRACRECGQPWRSIRDPFGWHRCEFALKLEREYGQARTKKANGVADDQVLGDALKDRLRVATDEEQISLDCIGIDGCPE